jgi:hypothetical protein
MGGRGGSPRTNLETAVAQAAARAETPAAALSPVDMVRQAFANAVQPGQEWVRLPEIREELAAMGLGRQAQDAAIEAFALSRSGRLSPVANLKSLRPQDRDAAIRLGGEMKHAISIDRNS